MAGPPELGCFRIDKPEWIPTLLAVYRFEAQRLSGPSSHRKDIRQVMWRVSDLASWSKLDNAQVAQVEQLVDEMVIRHQALKISGMQSESPYFLTRVAESVRLLGHTHEYWYRGRSGVEAIQWLVQPKLVPVHSIPAPEFIDKLIAELNPHLATEDDRHNVPVAIRLVVQGIGEELATRAGTKDWSTSSFSHFQLRASIEMLRSQFDPQYKSRTQILTAGVGSGKTIGFAVATLVSAVASNLSGARPHRCHLIVYPRKALALDQFDTIQRFSKRIDTGQLKVILDHSSQYGEGKQYRSAREALPQIYGEGAEGPDVVVTTFETLRRRLFVPEFSRRMSRELCRVVLDEVHLAEGLTGAHIALLMTRLKGIASSHRILWTAASATAAAPEDHAGRIFGVDHQFVKVVRPDDSELHCEGIVHHVFLRPSGAISNLGVLVNSTSLLVHNRRNGLSSRPLKKDRQRSIGFADSLDLLGRWDADLRENERTENSRARPHPSNGVVTASSWNPRQRELPYAFRYIRPFDRRIAASGGKAKGTSETLEELPARYRDGNLCARCVQGERVNLGPAEPNTLHELAKLVVRSPHDSGDKIQLYRIQSPVFDDVNSDIGTLDLCPYLRAGACLWFPSRYHSIPDGAQEIQGSNPPRFDWASTVLSKVHTAKVEEHSGDVGGDLAEIVFEEAATRLFDVPGISKRVPVNVVLASPSLEVGVDIPLLTESLMTKAIRNVASYRQKAGRIGRDPLLDVINVTLMTDTPIDLHFYRQPQKLVSLGRLDPIPLKDRNEAVIRCNIYAAVWDWLARESNLPEQIPTKFKTDQTTYFAERLRDCLRTLNSNREEAARYLSGVSREIFAPDSAVVAEAINQVRDELSLLVAPAEESLRASGAVVAFSVADALCYRLSEQRGRDVEPAIPRELLERFDRGVRRYQEVRKDLEPVDPFLRRELESLDAMIRTEGWEVTRVQECKSSLTAWSVAHPTHPRLADLTRILDEILPRIQTDLETLKAHKSDLRVLRLYTQYERLLRSHHWKAYYLSSIIQELPIFGSLRRSVWHVLPENLFTDPYASRVNVAISTTESPRYVSVEEALFGFLPGTWTYRLAGGCFKVKSGGLSPGPGGRLWAEFESMNSAGTKLMPLNMKVSHPFSGLRDIPVFEPTAVATKRVWEKYLPWDRVTGLVFDGDDARERSVEATEEGGQSPPIKIPRSYPNSWVEVVPETSDFIPAFGPPRGEGRIVVTESSAAHQAGSSVEQVRHPMIGEIIEEVRWHSRLSITEYVLSITRSYSTTSGDGVEVAFRDQYGRFALGTQYPSEGVSFTLNENTVRRTIDRILESVENNDARWNPTLFRAFIAHLAEIASRAGVGASSFGIADVAAIVLGSLWPVNGSLKLDDFENRLRELAENRPELERIVREYLARKTRALTEDEETVGGRELGIDDPGLARRTEELIATAHGLASNLAPDPDYLRSWVRRAILNSFGASALTALQRYSGATDSDVGYSLSPGSWELGGPLTVFLYDRATYGNGCSAVAANYLHVPHVFRHGTTDWSSLLPSDDFLTTFEEELLQCPQFHVDLSALNMLAGAGGHNAGIFGLTDVEDQAREVLRVSQKTWEQLGVTGPVDAWRLALARELTIQLRRPTTMERDDLVRATATCWNGCPECILRGSDANSISGRDYLDKAVLDAWFETGRQRTSEYVAIDPRQVAVGGATLPLGGLHRVVFELADRRIRSMSLPWTIGLQVERGVPDPVGQLLIRTSDVRNLMLQPTRASGGSSGIGSLGFKRLLWFDLLMTAYLDKLNLIPAERRWVELVYYDCRDINFDDVGLSPRMLAAVSEGAVRGGPSGRMERLSDILSWLLDRGFRVSVCVDQGQAAEAGVREFLTRLESTGSSKLEIRTKHLESASMHAKGFVTPVAVLEGSANLTQSGAGRNEEIITHHLFGPGDYTQLSTLIHDYCFASQPWQSGKR
jgi:hypothetical protein